MASDYREDYIGPWSEQKLQLNKLYLPAYMRIMAKHRHRLPGGIHYIDGFSGTGKPLARGEERRVDGSPSIALALPQPFDSYTFIEREPWRAQRLRELCKEFPDRNARVIEADCNDAITQSVTPVVRWENFARGFAYLDPFGLQLKYATIEAIAVTRAIEVVINLPTMAMNRHGLPNDPSKLTQVHYVDMDSVWGNRDWYDLIYRECDTLFGPQIVKYTKSTAARLGTLFKRHRLERIFPYVGDPFVVTNSGGQPIYCLIFASPNRTGAKIADDVFRSVLSARPIPRSSPRFSPGTLSLPLPM